MVELISLCLGHFACIEDKCFQCRISPDNEKLPCYNPTTFFRTYQGKTAIEEMEKHKLRNRKAIDYYSAGQVEGEIS
jgi:hypothetical protein